MERAELKLALECATSFESADAILKAYTDFKTDAERIAFLRGMFDCEVVFRDGGGGAAADYVALLTTIVEYIW